MQNTTSYAQASNKPTNTDLITTNYEYFHKSVIENKKENFFSGKNNTTQKNECLEEEYKNISKKILLYKEHVANRYPDYKDFDFMLKYVDRIFINLYKDNSLISVFETDEIKEKFFKLVQKYLYSNHDKMLNKLSMEYFNLEDEIQNTRSLTKLILVS
ncbi:MAG: hypothetical protein PHR68_05285 [Candidatus Gracilibacteria bacterium]|nr:hypothetical protein [Candidatus Gracilibacteria bacterium]